MSSAQTLARDTTPIHGTTLFGAAELSWHIINGLVEDEFDVTTCQQMAVDHALSIPFELAWPDASEWPVRVVPIGINTVQHPLPSAKRCLALGRSVHKALQSWQGDERVVIIGTGGLSHQLDGARAGFINKDYDTFCLNNLASDPDAAALAAFPWTVPGAGAPLRDSFDRFFADAGVPHPRVPIESGSVMMIRQILIDSDFLTMLSPDQVAAEIEAGWLARVASLPRELSRTIGVTTRASWRPTVVQREFMADLAAAAGEVPG